MTVKRCHRRLHSVMQTPPASISAAGTVFKSFILFKESVQQKETTTVSETFLRINDKASRER